MLKFKYQVVYKNSFEKGKITLNSKHKLIDFKKRILKKLGYSEEEEFKAQIHIMVSLGGSNGYYVPLESDRNFEYMVERQLKLEY